MADDPTIVDRHSGVLDRPGFAPGLDRANRMVTQMPARPMSMPEDLHRARPWPSDLPMLLDGDLLQVTNDGSTRLVFRWARKNYVIEAGETEWVLFQALVNSLGDPRSMEGSMVKYDDPDSSTGKGIIPRREEEWTRLFAKYAIANEDLIELESKSPQVTVKNTKGMRVHFPVEDPRMLPFPAPPHDDPGMTSDVTRMMDGIRGENDDLRSRVESLEALLQAEITRRGETS